MQEKSVALRYNAGKLQWHLVDFDSLKPLVEVLMYGAQKYSPDNWKKGMDLNVILDCLQRHTVELMQGRPIDQESGKPHIGHVLANAMMYAYYTETEEGQQALKRFKELQQTEDARSIKTDAV